MLSVRLTPRRLALAPFISKQNGYVRVPSPSRVLAPAGTCFQPQCQPALDSCRSYFSWTNERGGFEMREWLDFLSALGGALSLVDRVPSSFVLLGPLQEFRHRLYTGGPESVFPGLQEHMLQKSLDVIGVGHKSKGIGPGSNPREFQGHFHELYVLMALQCCVGACKTSQIRLEHGIPILLTDSLSWFPQLVKWLDSIPKLFKPIVQPVQPLGDVDAAQLRQSNAFSAVLAPVQDMAEFSMDLERSQHITQIKLQKEHWIGSHGLNANHSLLNHLLMVHDPSALASCDGILYFKANQIKQTPKSKQSQEGTESTQKATKGGEGAENQFGLFSYDLQLQAFGPDDLNLKGLKSLAVSSDRVVACFSTWVECRELSGNHWTSWTWKPDDLCGDLFGLSMDDSHAYFCVGHSVVQLDLGTQKQHTIMGQIDKEGKGSPDLPPTQWLLKNPKATAVADSLVFIADAGNNRVICWDMIRNVCSISFESKSPSLLAADGEGFCVYDSERHQFFHLSTATSAVNLTIGSGQKGSTREVPASAANLGRVQSMSIRTTGQGRQLCFVCQDEDYVHACALDVFKPAGLLSATASPKEERNTGNALVPFHDDTGNELVKFQNDECQPTCGTQFQRYSQEPSSMILSEPLPVNQKEMSIKWTIDKPESSIGICLIAESWDGSNKKTVDSHIISSPEWGAKTYVTTISEMMKEAELKDNEERKWHDQPFRKGFETGVEMLRKFVKNINQTEPTEPKKNPSAGPFHYRGVNNFEVTVTRDYDESADSFTWKLTDMKVNRQTRAQALNAITVGVNVPVRICILAGEGKLLHCRSPPKINTKGSYAL